MKHLTIIRHAKSSWENQEGDDITRTLNERGKNAITLIGNYLFQQNVKPDLIISSPARRALDTATGIGELVKYDVKELKVEPVVYFGVSSAVTEMLKDTDDRYMDVFLFGHEPILSSLILHFTNTALEKFPTCSAFRIAFDVKKWERIKSGSTEFFIIPKQFAF